MFIGISFSLHKYNSDGTSFHLYLSLHASSTCAIDIRTINDISIIVRRSFQLIESKL